MNEVSSGAKLMRTDLPHLDQTDTAKAVDRLVDFLLPRGSGSQRFVRVFVTAEGEEGEEQRVVLEFRRASTYMTVIGYLDEETPSYVIEGKHSMDHNSYSSAPVAGTSLRMELGKLRVTRKVGFFRKTEVIGRPLMMGPSFSDPRPVMEPVLISGPLLTYTHHSSGWTERLGDTLEALDFEARTITVTRVVIGGEPAEKFKRHKQDGEWVNPNPETLTGPWGALAAQMSLADCGYMRREIRLNAEFRLYHEYEEGRFKDVTPRDLDWYTNLKASVYFEWDHLGRVVRVGTDMVEPFYLTRDFWMSPEIVDLESVKMMGHLPPQGELVLALNSCDSRFMSGFSQDKQPRDHKFGQTKQATFWIAPEDRYQEEPEPDPAEEQTVVCLGGGT